MDISLFLAMSQNPGILAEELTANDRFVVIDEIQRLPILLNEVHRLIEERGIRFLLTGSSARKLRSSGVNLLGGRARTKYLHPLTFRELGQHFDLIRAIERGLIFRLTQGLICSRRSLPRGLPAMCLPSAVS